MAIKEGHSKATGKRGTNLILLCLVLLGTGTYCFQLAGGHAEKAWQAYLINFLLWSGVAQGAFLFSVVLHVTKARWGRPLQGLAESFAAFFPVSFLLFLLLFLGKGHIFPWAGGDLQGRAGWLNLPFLFGRDAAGLLVLYGVGFAYAYHAAKLRKSRMAPASPEPGEEASFTHRMSVLGVLYILAYALVLSLLAFDLVMSAEPLWVSTLFGPYAFVKAFYTGLGALIILSALVSLTRGDASGLKASHFHDLGKLFFGFCLLWADFFYCQFLVIWYGNIPEETAYIIRRTMLLPWRPLAWTVFIMGFVIPFLVLLNRKVKTKPLFMIVLSSLVFVGIWLEHLLLVGPALNPGATSLPLGLADGLIGLGFLCLMVLSVRVFLGSFPESMHPAPAEVG